MGRITLVSLAALLGLTAIVGCGEQSSQDAVAASSSEQVDVQSVSAADPVTNPAARAASEFLDAVLQGDTERAGAQLTPLAIQQINQSGKQFAPPGLDNATFRVGEVRTPSETQAIVQCELTHTSSDGNTRREEMCCLMRLVDNQWRVSGIASSNGAGRPPMILDFENPPPESQVPPMAAAPGQVGTGAPATSRPSPPRSAEQSPPPSYR